MAKWIRWWGLIVFCSLVAITLLFWFVFADGLVRRAVEKAGTSLVGAEVDVAGADVTFSPLGVRLSGIAVTDPSSPGMNSLELSRVAFSLELLELLRRKVIIKEMAVEGFRFDTPRKRPGFVVKPPEKKPAATAGSGGFTLPSGDLPSAKTILAKESLASLSIIDETSSQIDKNREDWQRRVNGLPDRAKLDSYRSRVDKLKAASRSRSLSDAKTLLSDSRDLTGDLKNDITAVRQARSALTSDYAAARDAVDRAMRSPQEDIRRIREKYGLSASGAQNLSRTLFGGAVSSWIDRGFLWYGRLQPLFAGSGEKKGGTTVVKPLRAKGVDVRFREERPLPGLLVSFMNASMKPAAGTFDGEIRNITPEQDVLGSPLTFSFAGNGLQQLGSIKLSGTLDHVRPDASADAAAMTIRGYRITDMVLPGSTDLPATIREGLADISVSGKYDGSRISAHVEATARSVKFASSSEGSSGGISGAISSALEKVGSFSVTVDIAGTPDNYDVKITSDLDRVLKDAAGKVLGDKVAQFEKDLAAAIQERTGGKVKALQDTLGGMGALGGKIEGTEEQLNGLLRDATSLGGKTGLPF